MNKFTWSGHKKPLFILAPIANISTIPFRSICREMGADVVFSPMVSSNAVIYNEIETLKVAAFLPQEQPVVVQLYGYDGDLIAKAATIIDKKLKPAGIDINMGCPAKKIVGNESGSALLKDVENALTIVKKVRDGYSGQLSVKLRLGWKSFEVLDFVKELEIIGVDAISVHGRTTKQGYSGTADWEAINLIASSVKIPVIGNGDIKTWQEAYKRLDDGNLAGVMIGRGALGNPWIFKEIKLKKDIIRTPQEIAEVLEKQINRNFELQQDAERIVDMRKHLGWYIKGFAGSNELKRTAMQASTPEDIKSVLSTLRTLK